MVGVFLDRDGVINRNVYYRDTEEWESPRRPNDFRLHKGVLEALSELQAAEFLLFLVSNQPSHAKGKMSMVDFQETHARFVALLEARGVFFREFFYCLHHPKGIVPGLSGPCDCRKPSPHFLFKAREIHGLDFADCWLVGDRDSDIACGQAAGVRTIQVDLDHPGAKAGQSIPTFKARDLAHAVALILGHP